MHINVLVSLVTVLVGVLIIAFPALLRTLVGSYLILVGLVNLVIALELV